MALHSKPLVPRWYQEEAVQLGIWDYFESHPDGNPLLALPTGTGKSVIIALLVKRALKEFPQTRILKLTHVKELIQQNFDKLISHWPTAPAGIYSAGLGRRDIHQPITFAGIASVAGKPELFGSIDLVIIDEAHTLGPKESSNYQKFLKALREVNPNIRIIGLTATPYRMGQGMLTEDGLFTDISYDLTSMENFNLLVAEGFLCPLVPKATNDELDVSGVQVNNTGDYNLGQLQAAVDRAEITSRAIQEMLVCASDRNHWLIFASGVEHSDHICAELEANGISARSVHSKMDGDRDEAIRLWKKGKIRALVNNNVLTTGIDFPGIDMIGILRPTKSVVLWVQMLGRGTRPCEGKTDCLVLDFAGNTKRLGPINDPVIPRKRGAKGSGGAPVKICPVCMVYNHASVRFCTTCGEEFVAKVNFRDTASTLELLAKCDPKFSNFNITEVTYHKHQKLLYPERRPDPNKPPCLRVTYFSGPLQSFTEFVCFEHTGLALHRAHDWWRLRAPGRPMPTTIEEVLESHAQRPLPMPKAIRVWMNRKHGPEIKLFDWTGEGFKI